MLEHPGRILAGRRPVLVVVDDRVRDRADRDTVAEHVPHVDVAPVGHDLHARRTPTLVGVGQMPDAAPDALRRLIARVGPATRIVIG